MGSGLGHGRMDGQQAGAWVSEWMGSDPEEPTTVIPSTLASSWPQRLATEPHSSLLSQTGEKTSPHLMRSPNLVPLPFPDACKVRASEGPEVDKQSLQRGPWRIARKCQHVILSMRPNT